MLENIHSPKDLKKLHISELEGLAKEIRREIISTTLKNGGHLASNLGAVELTLAIHYVFDAPEDKIVFDVGHQCYTHKLVTDRFHAFSTLRKKDGISGFPNHRESEYDTFDAGHSSTAISSALGLARARDINKDEYNVVAVVGDGAIGGGMSLEALNDAGVSQNTRLIIVLNDNEMSISKNVGALSSHFSKLRATRTYLRGKRKVKKALNKINQSGKLAGFFSHLRNSFRYLLIGETIFDAFGIKYLGPVNGHSFKELIDMLRRARECQGPVIVHAVTCKGYGYDKAEDNPEMYHGVSPKRNGCLDEVEFSKQLGITLERLAQNDKTVCAVTAGMTLNTGLMRFSQRFSDRFFDTGIAEQHALAMAGGLAKGGMRPFVVIYSTFLQRGLDQIFHDICLQDLPVTICIDHAGLTGEDGATHQGVYDLGFLRSMPNLIILAPRTSEEFDRMLSFAAKSQKPVAIRYPKGHNEYIVGAPFSEPKWDIISEGERGCIIAFGAMLSNAKAVAERLNLTLIDARSIKPLDGEVLDKIKDEKIYILEDNALSGSFFEAVLDFYAKKGYNVHIRGFALNDEFVSVGNVDEQQHANGIDTEAVIEKIKNEIG